MGKRFRQTFYQKQNVTANEHTRKGPTSLVVSKMQIKTTAPLPLPSISVIKKTNTARCCGNVRGCNPPAGA